jgi:hypothetical protein
VNVTVDGLDNTTRVSRRASRFFDELMRKSSNPKLPSTAQCQWCQISNYGPLLPSSFTNGYNWTDCDGNEKAYFHCHAYAHAKYKKFWQRQEREELRRIRYYQNADRFLEAVYRSVPAVLEDLKTQGVAVLNSAFYGPERECPEFRRKAALR